jgi:uncharacterized protein YndB with AHSA1/START domain
LKEADMTTRPDRKVSVERFIPAPPEAVFDVLADPARHSEIDGSGSVKAAGRKAPRRLSMGAKFGMKMKIGIPYPITNTVVEFEENRLIGWRHFGGHVWRYELEPVDGGTKVTETFDWSDARSPKLIERQGYPEKHPEAMARTLERLERAATA